MAELLPPGAPLVEGAHSAQIAAELARRHNVETPIIDVVAAIIGGPPHRRRRSGEAAGAAAQAGDRMSFVDSRADDP